MYYKIAQFQTGQYNARWEPLPHPDEDSLPNSTFRTEHSNHIPKTGKPHPDEYNLLNIFQTTPSKRLPIHTQSQENRIRRLKIEIKFGRVVIFCLRNWEKCLNLQVRPTVGVALCCRRNGQGALWEPP